RPVALPEGREPPKRKLRRPFILDEHHLLYFLLYLYPVLSSKSIHKREQIGICRVLYNATFLYKLRRFRRTALTATITVLADIRMAANAGWRSIPHEARTPAARGRAKM